MSKKKIAWVVDAETGACRMQLVEDRLQSYYKLIGTDIIDIVRCKIGGKEYAIVCDDEALFKEQPKFTAIDDDYHAMLYGTLVILRDGNEGELDELSVDDVINISEHIVRAYTEGGKGVREVVQIEY